MEDQGITPALGRDTTKFELDVDGQPQLKAYPDLAIVNSGTRKPLSLNTIDSRGGGKAIWEDLGFVDWTRSKKPLSVKAATALSNVSKELGEAAAAVDTIELQNLGQTAKDVETSIHNMETTFTDAGLDEVLGTINDPPLNLRELRGLDLAMQTIRGELTNNLAKLSELDDHIAQERRKMEQADSPEGSGIDEFARRRIAERLRDLQDE